MSLDLVRPARRLLARLGLSAAMALGALTAPAMADDAPLTPRVIGGGNAPADSQPWTVSLRSGWILPWHFCTGTVIHPNWVLTAAHCVDERQDKTDQISVGYGTEIKGLPMKSARVKRVVIHPDYDWPLADVALVELDRPLEVQPLARLGARRASQVMQPGTDLLASGWGVISQTDHTTPLFLQQVDLPLVKTWGCHGYEGTPMICAGGLSDGGKGICYGDSGGPLTVADRGRPWLVGVTAMTWSYPTKHCGLPGMSDGFTDVSVFNKWINAHVPVDASATPSKLSASRGKLGWQAVPDAEYYRVELSGKGLRLSGVVGSDAARCDASAKCTLKLSELRRRATPHGGKVKSAPVGAYKLRVSALDGFVQPITPPAPWRRLTLKR